MPRQRIWTLLLLGGAIGALMLLASGLSTLTFAPGHVYDFRGWLALSSGAGAAPSIDPSSIAFWQAVLAIVSLGLLLYLAIALILSAELRRLNEAVPGIRTGRR